MRSRRSVFSMAAIATVAGLGWTATATAQIEFKLTASDAAEDQYFGCSVAINDDYAIVGAVYEVAPGTGAACVYTDLTSPPLISLSTAALFMGTMSPGVTRVDSVKVENTGTAARSVSAIAVSGADAALFTVTPSTLTVSGGDSAFGRIVFAPTDKGILSATLTLTHDAAGGPSQVALTGAGGQTVMSAAAGT